MTETSHVQENILEYDSDYWGVENTEEFSEFKVSKIDDMMLSSMLVDEIKNGKKTDRKKKIYYIALQRGKHTRWAKLGAQSIKAVDVMYGGKYDKMIGKTVVPTHAEVNGYKYVIWKPKGIK